MKNAFALFLGTQDGSTFKAQVKFAPYFYIGTKVNKSDLILSDLVVVAESFDIPSWKKIDDGIH